MSAADEFVVTRPLSTRQLIALDSLVAAGILLLIVPSAIAATQRSPAPIPIPLAIALVLVVGLPVVVRRRWPVGVALVTGAGALLALLLGVTPNGFVATALALYLVALRDERLPPALTRAALATVAVALTLLVVAGSPAPELADIDMVIVPIVLLAGAWAIGRAVAERRAYVERAAAERVELAVAGERLRIARDLHDIVAHGLGLIAVTAATGNHVAATRPEHAREALRTIETTARDALAEMRTLLDVLRLDGDPSEADLSPSPGVADLPLLADRLRSTGVSVALDIEPDRIEPLPEGVSLVVFRVVQEALTNVVRHAAASTCRVAVRRRGDGVEVEVMDDGRAAPDPGPPRSSSGSLGGHGLVGMRERVRLLGGELEVGPMARGGFRVRAWIPVHATRPSAGAPA